MGTSADASGCTAIFRQVLLNIPNPDSNPNNPPVCTQNKICYVTTASSSVCTFTMWDTTQPVSPLRTITYDLATGEVQAD